MKTDLKLVAGIVILIIVGGLTLMYGQTAGRADFPPPPPPDGRHGPGGPGARPDILARLDLTEEQQGKINAIQTAARDASQEYLTKTRAADEQLRALIEGGNFTTEAAT